MADWLVARTRPQCEQSALERIHRLGVEGVEAYAPRFKASVRCMRRSRQRSTVRPLYPCYLFVKSPKFHYFLRDVEGITSIVMHGAVPARSNSLDEAIGMLQAREHNGFLPAPVEPPKFSQGDKVRITSGPFARYSGVVARVTRGKRVQVLLKWLGRENALWYSESDLAAKEATTSPLALRAPEIRPLHAGVQSYGP